MPHKIHIAHPQLGRAEIEGVRRVLKSGHLRAGALTERFESEFARFVGARFGIAVNSGTSALFLAAKALLRPGDEVIVPDFTFVATASMVLAAGARPVFADVNEKTFTLEPADVERRITSRTRAILPVHLYGHPADILALERLAKRHRLHLIGDAAQAHGAKYQGQDVGSFRDIVCYSFYPTKNLTTAEGGMLVTSNTRLAEKLRLMRSHGERRRYEHVCLGYNLRFTDIAAAIGLAQLRRLSAGNRKRRQNAAALARELAGIAGIEIPQETEGNFHVYNSFTIRLNPKVIGMSRDEFRARLARHGIETAVHYPLPLHRQPLFRGYGRDEDFPVSTRLAKTVLSLPVHPALTTHDLNRMIRVVRNTAAEALR